MFVVETGGGRQRMFTSTTVQPSAPLATDWIQNAVNHYVHNFVIKPEGGLPGMHNVIPQLYSSCQSRSYLQSAIQAVALGHLARVNRMSSQYLRKAQVLHNDAVQSLRVALDDVTEACSATAMMTTELLWQYDVRYASLYFCRSHLSHVPLLMLIAPLAASTGNCARKKPTSRGHA